jgi:hypothetical protein
MDFSYTIQDLTDLKWHGDHSISTFVYVWRQIVSRMRLQLPTEMLMDTLHAKMEGSAIMSHDIAHFNRCEPNHPDRSYEYLLRCMDKCVDLHQQASNRLDASKGVRGGAGGGLKGAPAINGDGLSKAALRKAAKALKALAAPGAAPAPGKGAGKGKGKPDATTSGERVRNVCWYHNHGGCTKMAAQCTHEHRIVSKAEAALLYMPPGAKPKAKAAPGGPAAPAIIPDPKAKAKPKAKPAPQNLNWCRAFLTQAGCPKSAADCDYPHLDNEAAKLCKQKQDRAKAKAKAKAAAAEG